MPTTRSSTASNACAFCRKRKRSCNRLLPKCSTCASKGIDCDYSYIVQAPETQQNPLVSDPGSSGPPLLRSAAQTPSFPAVYFLDHQVFRYGDVQVPKVSFTILPFIIDSIGDPQTVTKLYLERVHWWMPIISKKRLYDHLLNPLANPGAEVPLLLLAMKILMWKPSEQFYLADPKTQAYIAAKHAVMEAATAGVLTLQLLQTQILLAIYELGHAIYPAAYLSIGSCARYGMALGVDKSLHSNTQNSSLSILEHEERRRAWWAILILDRFMQLGNPTQQLSTEDPTSTSVLPADDQAFDQGRISDRSFTISAPASIEMGMLARMSQAAYLLGCVHRYNTSLSLAMPDHQAERWQLDRTLRSLLNLTYVEGQIRRMAVCAQSGICYSALIALHDPSSSRTDPEHVRFAMDLLKPVADSMSWDSEIFLSGTLVSVEDASPLLLFWAYQAATIYSRLVGRYGDEALQPLGRMKEKLQIMSHRWKAGVAYLQILDARQLTRMDSNAQ